MQNKIQYKTNFSIPIGIGSIHLNSRPHAAHMLNYLSQLICHFHLTCVYANNRQTKGSNYTYLSSFAA